MSEGSKRTSGERTGQSKSTSSGGGADAGGGYDSEKARTTDLLCTACDRCRAKKTKCDGERPCNACKTFYMRENKLKNMGGVDLTAVGCSYSPAKKRGPPATRKSPTKSSSSSDNVKEKKKKKHKKRHEGEQVHAAQPQLPPVGTLPSPAVEGSTTAATAATILNLLNSSTMQPAGGLQQAAGNPLLFPPPVSNPLPQQPSQQPPQHLSFLGAAGPTQQQPLAALQQLIQLVSIQQAQQQQQQQSQQQQLIQQLQQHLQQPVQQPQPIPAQQLQQDPSSPLSSSAEAEGGKSLRSEVDQLKERMRRLETENERLKERIELLHAKQSLEDD